MACISTVTGQRIGLKVTVMNHKGQLNFLSSTELRSMFQMEQNSPISISCH